MGAGGYFALAGLVVLLLPVVILPWEGRRTPSLFLASLGACGLLVQFLGGGLGALMGGAVTALAVLVLLGLVTTLLRGRMRLRILTGGQIKLMAAGAAWLGPINVIYMLILVVLMTFTVAAVGQLRQTHCHPQSAVIIATAIVLAATQQYAWSLYPVPIAVA